MNTDQIQQKLEWLLRASLTLTIALAGCAPSSNSVDGGKEPAAGAAEVAAAPTNRVDIPAAVRQYLGITFAKVEARNVSQTLRMPGRFEYLPTAWREYRTPLDGRVELLVAQYQRVEPGTPLYRVDSTTWQGLHESISALEARLESMDALREAHRRHQLSVVERAEIWQERVAQLTELRAAVGGNAAQSTEALATLNAAQAELAEIMEKGAELEAQQRQHESELRALRARRDVLSSVGSPSAARGGDEYDPMFTAHAVAAGVVESLGVTPGGLSEANGLVLTIVQPEQVRFRARALQADLGRLQDGLLARVVPPLGGSIPIGEPLSGVLQLALDADADERTLDLLVKPETLAPWARAGVAAHLEVLLAGGELELALPTAAIVRDGAEPIIFRRDAANRDKAIRMVADVGLSDGRWTVIHSGVKEGDEIVVGGNYQLMLATSDTAAKGGHFHPDGTFHEGKD